MSTSRCYERDSGRQPKDSTTITSEELNEEVASSVLFGSKIAHVVWGIPSEGQHDRRGGVVVI